MKVLEYAIQVTASVWRPFKQTYNGVSDDADFDSFGMAPWDAGGIHGDRSQLWDVMCRPTKVHEPDRKTTMNREHELDMIILIDTDSPRLTVTPGEDHNSYGGTQIRCDLRHTHDTSAMTDGYTMKPNDMMIRRTSFHPENASAEGDESCISPGIDSAAVELNNLTFRQLRLQRRNISAEREKNYVNVPAGRDEIDGSLNVDCMAVELNDVTFRQLRLPRRDISAEHDGSYVPPEIDSAVVELNDLTFRRLRLPRRDVSAEGDESCIYPGIDSAAVKLNNLTFRQLRLPRRNISAERHMNYVNVSARRDKIDGSLNVDFAAAELNDLFCRG